MKNLGAKAVYFHLSAIVLGSRSYFHDTKLRTISERIIVDLLTILVSLRRKATSSLLGGILN